MPEPGSDRFDLVIFDCDGVLVDSEGIAEEVWGEMAAELGAGHLRDDAFQRLRGERFAKCVRWLETELGRSLPSGFEEEFRDRSQRRFERDLAPIPGVAEALSGLRTPYCVASNGPRDKIELNLDLTGLRPWFEGRIFSAYELGVWKPDFRFYRKVAALHGLEPDRCAVVEDSSPGVEAALGAGTAVFVYAPGDEAPPHGTRPGAQLLREMRVLPALLGSSTGRGG